MATTTRFTRSKMNVVCLRREIRKLHIHARSLALLPDQNNCCHRRLSPCSPGVDDCVYHRICGTKASSFVNYSLQIPRRHFSAESYSKYFSPDVAPIGFAQKVLEGIHSATGEIWIKLKYAISLFKEAVKQQTHARTHPLFILPHLSLFLPLIHFSNNNWNNSSPAQWLLKHSDVIWSVIMEVHAAGLLKVSYCGFHISAL